ncbi:NTP transferase domain-containing protein [Blastochloris sulfoviridis]|uniref:NTP transferase domain-containing protein n=1 Tax=Blastochloris sulfoviridis TaxID=50712 RepID=A0A5M6I2T7_9HYPH|nr:NTP transferase domain-containing protein [Blastochloris sulfoviridis]KAA5602521.1 NTP transferase domain-containing protein [Blastochloris sulfoviridis]
MAVNLIIPMAGRGSRFSKAGVSIPKPLVELAGRPFFWWATESVRRSTPIGEMVFVVLREHVAAFGIDARVLNLYPSARIIVIDEVTSGAAETGVIGARAIANDLPVAINDCDHAFNAPFLDEAAAALARGSAGALVGFRASEPCYSYVRMDEAGRVAGTVEKVVASPFAIAGCYLFRDAQTYCRLFESYRLQCPYNELFISGMFNLLIEAGGTVEFWELPVHLSFGTPDELDRMRARDPLAALGWS